MYGLLVCRTTRQCSIALKTRREIESGLAPIKPVGSSICSHFRVDTVTERLDATSSPANAIFELRLFLCADLAMAPSEREYTMQTLRRILAVEDEKTLLAKTLEEVSHEVSRFGCACVVRLVQHNNTRLSTAR